jgi:hypothetical protein
MNEVMILRRGGGNQFAVIGAEFPEGATCTCTGKKGTVLTAKQSPWIFNIPVEDEWTVAASGVNNSVKVEITKKGQCEKVKLLKSLELFTAGSGLATGYSITGNYISPAIPAGNFSKVTIKGRMTAADYGSAIHVGLSADPDSVSATNLPEYYATIDNVNPSDTKTVEINGFEGVDGDMYLGVWWSAAFTDMDMSADNDKLSLAHAHGAGEILSIVFE